MLEQLKKIAARLFGPDSDQHFRSGPPFPDSPDDPHSYVREARKRDPNDRSGAVALAEPDDEIEQE